MQAGFDRQDVNAIELGEGGEGQNGYGWGWGWGWGWGGGSGSRHRYCNMYSLILNHLIHSNNQFCSWYSVYPVGLTNAHPSWWALVRPRPVTWSHHVVSPRWFPTCINTSVGVCRESAKGRPTHAVGDNGGCDPH